MEGPREDGHRISRKEGGGLRQPKSNVDFWRTKFERNVERDSRNIASLESDGWTVVTVWECEIGKDLPSAVQRVGFALGKHPKSRDNADLI